MNEIDSRSLGFEISGDEGKVRIIVLGLERDSDDYYDGNWLRAHLNVKLEAFVGEFDFCILAQELERLYGGLRRMHETLTGDATLHCIEPYVEMRATIDKLGKVDWVGSVQYPLGIGATLAFSFKADQSYLSASLDSLKLILERYPVKGNPKS